MQLNREQEQALNAVKTFIQGDKSIFILRGYAGTGKTTLVKYIAEAVEEEEKTPLLLAPTGRAASVLSDKTGHPALTIHRAIYELDTIEVVEDDSAEGDNTIERVVYHFPLREWKDAGYANMVAIVDESSMVGLKATKNETLRFGSGSLLTDLLDWARPQSGGKIIFVGDPVQLPPVGENYSPALDPSFFEKKNLGTECRELRMVVRQEEGSEILQTANALRDLLDKPKEQRKRFSPQISGSDIVRTESERLPEVVTGTEENSIIVCYTNKAAYEFNSATRKLLYGNVDVPVSNDRLIICSNSYGYGVEGVDLLNGDLVTVLSSEDEVETHPVTLNYRGVSGKAMKKHITLSFRKMVVKTAKGEEVKILAIDNLLHTKERDLTIDEQKALFVDFSIRHRDLKPKSEQFGIALRTDPYFNAIHVKYGYAITCHKSQGGEWDTVAVDYTGKRGLSDDSLRWMYTATTRARKRLYAAGLSEIDITPKLKIAAITPCRRPAVATACVEAAGQPEETPFHEQSAENYLKAKYHEINARLEGSGFSIVNVDHQAWRERYTFASNGGTTRIDFVYNKKGGFKPPTFVGNATNQELMALLNAQAPVNKATEDSIEEAYEPSAPFLDNLYEQMQELCARCDIKIMNVKEDTAHYRVLYELETSAAYAAVNFNFTGGGDITYCAPMSQLGANDERLQHLINLLNN